MLYSANGFDLPAGSENESIDELAGSKFSIDLMVFLSKIVSVV